MEDDEFEDFVRDHDAFVPAHAQRRPSSANPQKRIEHEPSLPKEEGVPQILSESRLARDSVELRAEARRRFSAGDHEAALSRIRAARLFGGPDGGTEALVHEIEAKVSMDSQVRALAAAVEAKQMCDAARPEDSANETTEINNLWALARSQIEKSLELDPSNAEAYFTAAFIEETLGHDEAARHHRSRGLRLFSERGHE